MAKFVSVLFCALFLATIALQVFGLPEPDPEPQHHGGGQHGGGQHGGGQHGGGHGGSHGGHGQHGGHHGGGGQWGR